MADDAGLPHASAALPDGAPAGDLAILLTQVANGQALAALCALSGAKGRVIEITGGTVAVLDDASPEALDKAAAAVSSFAKGAPLVSIDRRGGQLTAWSYYDGVQGKKQPPGLLLSEAPSVVIALVTGTQTMDDLAADHPEKVHEARMGQLKAVWRLRRLAAKARREQRDLAR